MLISRLFIKTKRMGEKACTSAREEEKEQGEGKGKRKEEEEKGGI